MKKNNYKKEGKIATKNKKHKKTQAKKHIFISPQQNK